MALEPTNEAHALQIQAGILGRRAGHQFEDGITEKINALNYPRSVEGQAPGHVFTGDPATLLLDYVARASGKRGIRRAVAISTGALATSETGLHWLHVNGVGVKKCKSDLVISFDWLEGGSATVGVSTKQCNNRRPTNAQLYFTTAQGFANLLARGDMPVSQVGLTAMKQFCGESGHRPEDDLHSVSSRLVDPRRWFWEEIDSAGRTEWESLFSERQDDVSRLLFQKAYLDDPFTPDFLLHKTKTSSSWTSTEVALYGIDELIRLSRTYGGFSKRPYSVRKGRHRDPVGVSHDAPRFGIVQMQRGGQAQHPSQLQFNLEAGYFHKIEHLALHVVAEGECQ